MKAAAFTFSALAAALIAVVNAPDLQAADEGPELVQSQAEVATVSAEELKTLIDAGKVVLVDVRTPAEFDEARLHGSLNAPLQTFDPASIPMEQARETILYCRSSGRSGQAAVLLANHINSKVRHLEGGLLAWEEAGFPVIPNAEPVK